MITTLAVIGQISVYLDDFVEILYLLALGRAGRLVWEELLQQWKWMVCMLSHAGAWQPRLREVLGLASLTVTCRDCSLTMWRPCPACHDLLVETFRREIDDLESERADMQMSEEMMGRWAGTP